MTLSFHRASSRRIMITPALGPELVARSPAGEQISGIQLSGPQADRRRLLAPRTHQHPS